MTQVCGARVTRVRRKEWTGIARAEFLRGVACSLGAAFGVWAALSVTALGFLAIGSVAGVAIVPLSIVFAGVIQVYLQRSTKELGLARQTDIQGGTPPRLHLFSYVLRSEIPFQTPIPWFYGTMPAFCLSGFVTALPVTVLLGAASMMLGAGVAFLAAFSAAASVVFLIGSLPLLRGTDDAPRRRTSGCEPSARSSNEVSP